VNEFQALLLAAKAMLDQAEAELANPEVPQADKQRLKRALADLQRTLQEAARR
jgi:hypothetical protein